MELPIPNTRPLPRRAILAVCCLGMCAIAFAITGGPVFLTDIARDLHLGKTQQGIFLGTSCWGLTVAILLVGRLADRLGFRALMVLGAAMQIAGLALVSQATAAPAAYAGGTLLGLGCGVADAILSPIVCAVYPERRSRMAGLLHSFYAIGLVVAVLVLLGVIRAGWAWRSALLLLAAMIAPYGLLVLALPLPAHAHEGDRRMPARQVARRGAFWLLVGAIFMSGVTELGPGGWLPAFVRQSAQSRQSAATNRGAMPLPVRGEGHVPETHAHAPQTACEHGTQDATPGGEAQPAQAGSAASAPQPAAQAQNEQENPVAGALGLLAFGVTMAVGRLTTSAVIHRLGVRRLFAIGGALCAASLAMASLPMGPIWSAGWLALMGLGVAGFWPTILATAGDRFPRAGASMFSILSATGNLGGVVGPVVIGLVADCWGLHSAMRLMALVPVAAMVLIGFAVHRNHAVGRQSD
jgi:MFS family permease